MHNLVLPSAQSSNWLVSHLHVRDGCLTWIISFTVSTSITTQASDLHHLITKFRHIASMIFLMTDVTRIDTYHFSCN